VRRVALSCVALPCAALRCLAGRLTRASHLCHARRISPVGLCLVSGEPPLAGADSLAMSSMFVSIKPGPGPTTFVVGKSNEYTHVPSLSESDGSTTSHTSLLPPHADYGQVLAVSMQRQGRQKRYSPNSYQATTPPRPPAPSPLDRCNHTRGMHSPTLHDSTSPSLQQDIESESTVVGYEQNKVSIYLQTNLSSYCTQHRTAHRE
jgi:hypothetical protein